MPVKLNHNVSDAEINFKYAFAGSLMPSISLPPHFFPSPSLCSPLPLFPLSLSLKIFDKEFRISPIS